MVGVVPTHEAIERARAAGLDLVEVSAESDPPVCRILDFGKFKYEQAKKEKATKAKSKTVETKEVRLGRSMKIDPHDVGIRLKQARRFLMEGHKVQIVQNFRGREMAYRDKGLARLQEIVESLGDIARLEVGPQLNGRRMSMMLAPDRAKVEQVKRRLGAEAAPDLTVEEEEALKRLDAELDVPDDATDDQDETTS
jgi:translation initiation factor IF-3